MFSQMSVVMFTGEGGHFLQCIRTSSGKEPPPLFQNRKIRWEQGSQEEIARKDHTGRTDQEIPIQD